jgi:hypothetical protein
MQAKHADLLQIEDWTTLASVCGGNIVRDPSPDLMLAANVTAIIGMAMLGGPAIGEIGNQLNKQPLRRIIPDDGD